MASVSKQIFCCDYAKHSRWGVECHSPLGKLTHDRRLRTLSPAVVSLGSTPCAVAVPPTSK